MADRISAQAEICQWFPSHMGGFRRGRSSVDQVLQFTENIFQTFRRKKVCVTAYLDASKAYDRVFRAGLLSVMSKLGVSGRMWKWVAAFLRKREARERVGSKTSGFRDYTNGLPQGSCLSPILYNIFMSDLTSRLKLSEGVEVCIYADDVRVSAVDTDAKAAGQAVSEVLQQVDEWAQKMRVVFDTDSSKCGYMIFSRGKCESVQVSFGDKQLTRIKGPHRYLGIWMEENMSFRYHISKVRAKAWAALQSIRPLVKHGLGFDIMRTLYLTCVRAVLEYAQYASTVW